MQCCASRGVYACKESDYSRQTGDIYDFLNNASVSLAATIYKVEQCPRDWSCLSLSLTFLSACTQRCQLPRVLLLLQPFGYVFQTLTKHALINC
jgi:hypothetical protein